MLYIIKLSNSTMGDSAFNMSEVLESINSGVDRYDMQQIYPISGNIDTAIVGQGKASGLTTFQWQDSANWWSPYQSYFSLIVQFKKSGTAGALSGPSATSSGDLVTYCDNFVPTLFSQIQTYINSRPLDTVNTPWLIDTALTYSNAKQNFLKTWGSLTRIGESLQTRLINATVNNGIIEVIFRPPVSLFDVKLLPPGAQFRIDLNWVPSAINAFESIGGSIVCGESSGNYNLQVNSLSFYKASVHPANNVEIPRHGVIDLMPCQALQYFSTAQGVLKQNITLPSTTNRILVVFQDTSTPQTIAFLDSATTNTATVAANKWCGVGNGYNPATSFSNIFSSNLSTSTFATAASLGSLWLSLPELGIQEPSPIYQFNGIQDYMRAYSDFCHITQGTHDQEEGSTSFGNSQVSNGITIIAPNLEVNNVATPVYNAGDPNNPQQYNYITQIVNDYSTAAVADAATARLIMNQTARWGWIGRCPGPIFAFPVVRPEGKTISTGTLNVTYNTAPTGGLYPLNVTATIICSYNMAIAVELQPSGYYSYSLVEGV